MPQLSFKIEGSQAVPFAMAPTLAFRLRVENTARMQRVQGVALRCQIQIETTRRRYEAQEQNRLFDLFGEPKRWGQTLRSMLWTNVTANLPPFTGTSFFDLPVPCTFDFNVAATKYFAALNDGDVPLCFLFSGTIYYEDGTGALQVEQIPWENEAVYRLPVTTWQRMMDIYYPNQKWLTLSSEVFDLLYEYRSHQGLVSWEQAIEKLLTEAGDLSGNRVTEDQHEQENESVMRAASS
jgi:hypothetical protein